ncbi:MAG: serine/threonine-protein kinase [Anaeromyxobacteraceae bacterium]
MAPVLFAGCALGNLVGRGGMAEVWQGVVVEGPKAGREVAVKRLLPELASDPEYVAMLEQEALVTRRLAHPAIVEVLDAGVADGTPYIVMEYVDGRNLKEVIARCAERRILLPADFSLYVGHVVADALAHAHDGADRDGKPLGVVHCDVSPSNVFISKNGEVKLGDFGVAVTPTTRIRVGGVHGKVSYLAPELLRGGNPSPRSDVFSLGCLLFEALTNERAYPGTDVNAVAQKILQGALRAPSEVRPELSFEVDAIVLRCLAADPAERWPSALELAKEIAAQYDPSIGTPLAIAAVVRGLFGVK